MGLVGHTSSGFLTFNSLSSTTTSCPSDLENNNTLTQHVIYNHVIIRKTRTGWRKNRLSPTTNCYLSSLKPKVQIYEVFQATNRKVIKFIKYVFLKSLPTTQEGEKKKNKKKRKGKCVVYWSVHNTSMCSSLLSLQQSKYRTCKGFCFF